MAGKRKAENAAVTPERVQAARRLAQRAYEQLGSWAAVAARYNRYNRATYYRLVKDDGFLPSVELVEALESLPPLGCGDVITLDADMAARLDALSLPGETRADALRRLLGGD